MMGLIEGPLAQFPFIITGLYSIGYTDICFGGLNVKVYFSLIGSLILDDSVLSADFLNTNIFLKSN